MRTDLTDWLVHRAPNPFNSCLKSVDSPPFHFVKRSRFPNSRISERNIIMPTFLWTFLGLLVIGIFLYINFLFIWLAIRHWWFRLRAERPSLKMIIAVALISFSLFLLFKYALSQADSVPTPTAPRSIVSATLPLRELWRSHGILLRGALGFGPPHLSTAEGIVFFVNHSRGWSRARLQALDASTGQLLWQAGTDDGNDDNLSYEQSMAANRGRLFIAVDWNIRAYDLSNGRLLWRTPGSLPGHTGYDIYPVGDKLTVYSTGYIMGKRTDTDVFSVYNPATGELLERTEGEETGEGPLLWRTAQMNYRDDCRRLSAVDRASGNVIWQVAIKACIDFWPEAVDAEMFFTSRDGELFALDITTGSVLWRYPKTCYSNSAVMGGIVYAIRADGILVGINPKTGSEVGTIEFSPGSDGDGGVPTYWVAADGKRLFAYFGDSQELIAFSQ